MSGWLSIAAAATDVKSAAFGATGTVLTSTPDFLSAGSITPRPVALPCVSSVKMTDAFLTPSSSAAYFDAAVLSPI